MPKTPPEPKRQTSLNALEPAFAAKVRLLLAAMRRRLYDPIVFEAKRTVERQAWLYGVGRTHSKHRKPVSWFRPPFEKAPHVQGRAVDIISKKHWWGHAGFFRALKIEANKVGLSVLRVEQCHVEQR